MAIESRIRHLMRAGARLATLGALASAIAFAATVVHANPLAGSRCIVPAKSGGGFELTCMALRDVLRGSGETVQLAYQPGGIGALAWRDTVRKRSDDPKAVVAFSSGTLLNLAQGRFGPYHDGDVHWLAALGDDHGVIAVRQDAPWRHLRDLVEALRRSPGSIVFGAGGTIGSQDWMKAALLARAAGVSHRGMRFVAFEGGGEALTALRGDHVQVLTGDAAEIGRQIGQGQPVRVLAVLAATRLPGQWAQVPTAREQGFDIQWPILRGVYIGAGVREADRAAWTSALQRAMESPGAHTAIRNTGIAPRLLTGEALHQRVNQEMENYRRLAREFGLMR